jgi:dCMP deaminase
MNKKAYDEFGRPCLDLYAMNLCFEIAFKSIDPNTKHGCLVVDEYGGTLSSGFNGPPSGCIDKNIPLTYNNISYLSKYSYLVHSEANAIYRAARKGTPLENSIFYITGFPCINCLQGILAVKAKKIIYGPLSSNMFDEDYMKIYDIILDGQKIIIEKFKFEEELFKKNIDAKIAVTAKRESKKCIEINKEHNIEEK